MKQKQTAKAKVVGKKAASRTEPPVRQKAAASTPVGRTDSKQGKLIALLRRPKGASIAELMKATGWQAHTVRAVLSRTLRGKLQLNLLSERAEGEPRIYRIPA